MYFDIQEAREIEQFIGELQLTKSTRSGRPEKFTLLPHSKKLLLNLLGWRRDDGRRLYRKCYSSMGRKQAKTQTAAALAVVELFRSRETQPEIYMAAKDRDQASICFEAARSMIESNEHLVSLCKITPSKNEIRTPFNGGVMRAISSEGKGKHGYNPSLVIIDEFHVWGASEQELYNALTTGSKTRREPLIVIITTAGHDKETLCGMEYRHAKRVLSGEIQDPTYFPMIYEVPEDADWTNPDLWKMAMPGLGHICHMEDFLEEFEQAKVRPEQQNIFRRLYLNQWVNAQTQWIPMHKWDELAEEIDESALRDVPCYGGLDLGARRDLTAFTLCWPMEDGRVIVKTWGFIPIEDIATRCHRDNVPYDAWEQSGDVVYTPGAVTEWEFVAEFLAEQSERFNVKAVAFDRWKMDQILKHIPYPSFEWVSFGQGFRDISPALQQTENMIYSGRLRHNGSRLLRWNVDCATVQSDPAGNIKLVKPPANRGSRRIDGAVSMVMAVGISAIADHDISIWETRGRPN